MTGTPSSLAIDIFNPTRPDFSPYGLTCTHWQATRMPRPDHHSELELNFVRSGSVTYLLGGHRRVAPAGRLSAFWGATPHQIVEFSDPTQYIVATIPIPQVLSWALPAQFIQALLSGQFLCDPSDDRRDADWLLFDQWAQDLRQPTVEVQRLVLLEMQARLIRLATRLSDRPARVTAAADVSLDKIESMACYIACHYTEKLTVQQIAHHVQLNPHTAMTMFKRVLGSTLINYIVRHRVSHAQRLLATTDMRVTEIAFQSGFLSVSRFNEAFLRACSCSPRAYRTAIRVAS